MLFERIEEELREACAQVCPDWPPEELRIRKCPSPRFGDYQSNSIMALAKRSGGQARRIAGEIAERMPGAGSVCRSVEVAGPGFLNFRVRDQAVEDCLNESDPERCLVEPASVPRTVLVDFSSPNVAKPMHVGHIRSTNLGDCLARMLRFAGHRVITDNHIGDWGTQFGKLIVGWKTDLAAAALEWDALGELERLYRQINQRCETEPDTLRRSREELVALQRGEAANRKIWRRMIELSRRQFDELYSRLGVTFDHTLGESFYNDRLQDLVEEMKSSGLAQESEGAVMVFFPEAEDLKGHPAMIRKSDGASNYMTTDLATLEYRCRQWPLDEIVYVTDGRQQLHFRQLFGVWRRWRQNEIPKLTHVWFGSIMGPDGKPFKTRSGGTIRLAELLNEAEERARKFVETKNPDLKDEQKRKIAAIVGIGAVKYADLLSNRQSDYVFDWDTLLSLKGNTAPYLQYAYTRTCGIFRKYGGDLAHLRETKRIRLEHGEELDLARQMIDFPLALRAALDEYRPNYLCSYLYDLAGRLAQLYENCPILKAAAETRDSRLLLVDRAGTMIRQGLALLGIEVSDRM